MSFCSKLQSTNVCFRPSNLATSLATFAQSRARLPKACRQHLHACQAGRSHPARPSLQQQQLRRPRREQRSRNQQQQLRKPRREYRRKNRPRACRQHLTHARRAGLVRRASLCSSSSCAGYDGSRGAEKCVCVCVCVSLSLSLCPKHPGYPTIPEIVNCEILDVEWTHILRGTTILM